MRCEKIRQTLRSLADAAIAEKSKRFFKTGAGDYGEGDRFLGIRVPVLREQAKKFEQTPLQEVQQLLKSPFHEERLCALFILVRQFRKGSSETKHRIYTLYLSNTLHINNWDLVDSSAYQIVGSYLETQDKSKLYELVKSKSIWERRIAILSTFHFIRQNQFEETLAISTLLLHDSEDLIHKAVGWMLREVGKRDLDREEAFLHEHYQQMPRTMLRYAIEKFPQSKRQKYLAGRI